MAPRIPRGFFEGVLVHVTEIGETPVVLCPPNDVHSDRVGFVGVPFDAAALLAHAGVHVQSEGVRLLGRVASKRWKDRAVSMGRRGDGAAEAENEKEGDSRRILAKRFHARSSSVQW